MAKFQFVFLFLILGSFTAFPKYADAAPACDEDFYAVMEVSAWRSAKREIEAAEKIILHPDSVLEYSCIANDFSGVTVNWNLSNNNISGTVTLPPYSGRSSTVVAQEREVVLQQMIQVQSLMEEVTRIHGAGDEDQTIQDPSWTQETEWQRIIQRLASAGNPYAKGNPMLSRPQEMYQAWRTDYLALLDEYTDLNAEYASSLSHEREQQYNNRNNPNIGGGGVAYVAPPREYAVNVIGEHLTANYAGAYGGGTHIDAGLCVGMQQIWDHLRCRNFEIAEFRDFEVLAGADPRTLPFSCNEPGRDAKWLAANLAAEPLPFQTGGIDQLVTYLGLTSWFSTNSCNGVSPILTGVMVIGSGGTETEEAICPLPGCYNDQGQCR